MRRNAIGPPVAVALVLAVSSAAVWAQYDVYKNSQPVGGEPQPQPVPDVNKAPGPGPDNSCWLAAAANLLGGAGWGTGVNAQARGQSIYNDLVGHFGIIQPGYDYLAINYWLYNFGQNPASYQFNPYLQYTDVTHVYKPSGLMPSDYDWLLNELQRCQYASVSFDTGASTGHVMALVGGNFTTSSPPKPPVSVWHDSDDAFAGDNALTNSYAGVWKVDYNNTPTNTSDDWLANDYTTLCPGLTKPLMAIKNYDVAFYQDQNPNTGAWFVTSRVAGNNNYGNPVWDTSHLELTVPNEVIPFQEKDVYLLVDLLDRNNVADNILLTTPSDVGLAPTDVSIDADGGQILYHWHLGYQPGWETIVFPRVDYYQLSGDVKDFNIATICPEPATAGMLGAAAVWLLRRRRT